jgi:hypothetical protein
VNESSAPARAEPKWTFSRALLILLVLVLWAEATLALMRSTRSAEGSARILRAAGLFVALLPFFGLLVYRARWVFGFFRSVSVGVVNLILIGVGAIIGVLFQQEDPYQPTPAAAVSELVSQEGAAPERPWTSAQRFAYQDYLSFRNAQTFFTYHLLDSLGLRGAMGFHGPRPGAAVEDKEALANLGLRLPELRTRFGEEFAIAIESQSETGLRTRSKNAEIRELESRWDDLWWSTFVWADRLDFRRAYRSDWYAVFWTVLFCGVLSNTFRGGAKRLLKPKMWGFLVTHVGVLAVIAGGFLGRHTEERGILELHIGEQGGSYTTYQGGSAVFHNHRLFGEGKAFQVRLDEFRADHHDVLDVVFAQRAADGQPTFEFELARQPKLRVFAGKTAAYDWTGADGEPRLRLEVLEHAKQARTRFSLRAASPEEPGFPVARFRLEDSHGHAEADAFLVSSPVPGQDFAWPHGPSGTRVRLESVRDEAAARLRLAAPVTESYGRFILPPDSPAGSEQVMNAWPGERAEFQAGGAAYTVEFLAATPDFHLLGGGEGVLEAAPLEQDEKLTDPRNPAAQVRIRSADGREELRWILEREFSRADLLFPELKLSFRWDSWTAPALRRVIFFAFDNGAVSCGDLGLPDSLRPVGPGPFELSLSDGSRMIVLEAFAHGTGEPSFEEIPGADFYATDPPAIRLRVTTPGGERELVMDAAEQRPELIEYPGPNGTTRLVALNFREDRDEGELPIEWRSRLTILEQDAAGSWQEVDGGDIRVNDYFRHGGFRFFQTNHNPADPTYSGIGVVYDPGIELVLYGLYTVMFGTMAVFLVKPLFTRRHRGSD